MKKIKITYAGGGSGARELFGRTVTAMDKYLREYFPMEMPEQC